MRISNSNESAFDQSKIRRREEDLIDKFFGNRIYIASEDAAAILEVDVRTLRDLASAGRIGFVVAGTGCRKPRRRFTRTHIAQFLRDAVERLRI